MAAGGSKTRVGVILRQTTGSKSANASAELVELKERYKVLCQRFKTLNQVMKQRHAALIQTEKSKAAVS